MDGGRTEGNGELQQFMRFIMENWEHERREWEREAQERESMRRQYEEQLRQDGLEMEQLRRQQGAQILTMLQLMQESTNKSRHDNATVARLSESDDIEAYLTTFERTMGAFRIEESPWAFRLAPHLTCKAKRAFAAMDRRNSSSYEHVNRASALRFYS